MLALFWHHPIGILVAGVNGHCGKLVLAFRYCYIDIVCEEIEDDHQN